MNGVVLAQTLRQVRKTVAVLAVASGGFYYLVLLSSATFLAEDVPSAFLDDPPRFVEAFTGGASDFTRPTGWLVAAMTHPITLSLLVGAALVAAAGAVATEVERGSIDLVLVRPIGRVPFLTAKAVAAVLVVTLVQAGGLLGVLIARMTVERMSEIPVAAIGRAFLGSWALFTALAMVALLISAGSSLRSRAVGLAVGAIVAWYFMNFIALLIDEVSGIRFASPFHYFRAADVVAGTSLFPQILALVALAVASLGLAVWGFVQRDLSG